MHILWTIIIGFIVGVVVKFLMPGDKRTDKVDSNGNLGNCRRVRCNLPWASCRVVWALRFGWLHWWRGRRNYRPRCLWLHRRSPRRVTWGFVRRR